MGEGRQDQKAAPVKAAGSDPGGAGPPGKAPPLPARASANGVPAPRAPQVAAQDSRPHTPGSGISPVAPPAAPGLPPTWRFLPAGTTGRLLGWRGATRAVVDIDDVDRRLVVFVRVDALVRARLPGATHRAA
jgi:hypothetical protein